MIPSDLTNARLVDYIVGVNDIVSTFYAMARHVAFLIYPGFQLLDAAGPIAAFEIAERYQRGSYDLRVIAVEPGRFVAAPEVEA